MLKEIESWENFRKTSKKYANFEKNLINTEKREKLKLEEKFTEHSEIKREIFCEI